MNAQTIKVLEEFQKTIRELSFTVETLQQEVAILNSGEIYGGTLTDSINFLAESINGKHKK